MTLKRTMVVRALVLALLMALAPITASQSAQAAPYCGIRWGSLPKTSGDFSEPGPGWVDIRAGRHACFDRLVIDLDGPVPTGYTASYVNSVDRMPAGSLRGGATLVIRHPAWLTWNVPLGRDLINVAGYRTFRQVAWAGWSENCCDAKEMHFDTQNYVLGVRARLPFRVFTLPGGPAGGSRLVIDVAHRW